MKKQPRRIVQHFPSPDHDHRRCIDDAIARAVQICTERGERFTQQRRTVLELIWRGHRPVKAYDLLDAMAADGRRPAPPTVYRALDFLQAVGLVHKLESINAYIGCSDPARHHAGQFLICAGCGAVAEYTDDEIDARIDKSALQMGFKVDQRKIEVTGLCKACSEARSRS